MASASGYIENLPFGCVDSLVGSSLVSGNSGHGVCDIDDADWSPLEDLSSNSVVSSGFRRRLPDPPLV